MPHDKYVEWQRECLAGMLRVLRPDGAIFYNHKWRVQNGLLQDRQDIVDGFPVRQIIIWQRAGGINFNPGYFLPNYEVIYLIAKPEFRLAPKANAYGSVWSIKQEHNNPHPAPFPIELAARCIRSVGAGIVLDPFIGSGTTAIAAEMAGVPWLGIEKSPTTSAWPQTASTRFANPFRDNPRGCPVPRGNALEPGSEVHLAWVVLCFTHHPLHRSSTVRRDANHTRLTPSHTRPSSPTPIGNPPGARGNATHTSRYPRRTNPATE